jgi:hypothetical protein
MNDRKKLLERAAATLSKAAGRPITVPMLKRDIACGAPVLKPDGTLDVVRYAAWLARENCHSEMIRHRSR